MTIKEARIAAGLTQQGMSDKLGIPKRTIQDWESGRREPPAWAERLIIRELERIKEDKTMKEIKIIYEDGDYEYTKVYGSPEDIKKYYIGKWFNVGTVTDEMKKCTDVVFL